MVDGAAAPSAFPTEKIILLSVDLLFLPTRSSSILGDRLLVNLQSLTYLGSISEADFLVHT